MKEENLKERIIVLIFIVVFTMLFVLLLTSVNNYWNATFQTVDMLLILAMSLIATIYPLIKKERTKLPELLVIFICVSLLVVSVIVFASLATDKYKDAVIQISASCIGGMISLYGIGLTIKHNRLEKEKDDIAKAKPNIFPISEQMWASLEGLTRLIRDVEIRSDLSTLKKVKRCDAHYEFAPIYLANSDLSMCTFKGIIVNENETIVFQYDNVLLKGSNNCFKLDYCFKYVQEIESIQLILGDMFGHTYGCYMSFVLEKKNNGNKILVLIKGTKKIQPLNIRIFSVFDS